MKEYICKCCGNVFQSEDKEVEVECPECMEMDAELSIDWDIENKEEENIK